MHYTVYILQTTCHFILTWLFCVFR